MLKDDIEEEEFNRPKKTSKLLSNLETAMNRAIQEKQYSAVGRNEKVLIRLIDLNPKTQIR